MHWAGSQFAKTSFYLLAFASHCILDLFGYFGARHDLCLDNVGVTCIWGN